MKKTKKQGRYRFTQDKEKQSVQDNLQVSRFISEGSPNAQQGRSSMGGPVKVAEKKDIPAGSAKAVDLHGKKIAIFNVEGRYYAIDDTCTHVGGSLSEGDIEGTIVTCPWHGAKFDITNGEVLGEPAEQGVKSYKIYLEGEDLKIEM